MKKSLLAVIASAIAIAVACSPAPNNNGGNGNNNPSFNSDGGSETDAGNQGTDAGNQGTDAGNQGVDAGAKLDCASVVGCENACTSAACQTACQAKGSSTAVSLDDAAGNCINTTCPQTDGGACADTTSTTCQNCVSGAQQGTGACVSDVNACFSDTSGANNCFGMLVCASNCTTSTCQSVCLSTGDATANTDFTAFNNCVNTACPQTGTGAACATPTSTACQNCVSAAQASGGACATQFATCQSDF